jgi:hypothetical protein
MASYHLAQLNIGRLRAPLDSADLAPFVEALEPVNRLADAAPGFVWRLETEDGNATSIHAFDDDMLLINMSVWESIDALAEFVYRTPHRDILRRRAQFFERPVEAFLVLWWIPAGTVPTIDDAKNRLESLRRDGPTAAAFTFRSPFPPPDGSAGGGSVPDDWYCRA